MTLAVRGIGQLFKLLNREKELQREILAFSILLVISLDLLHPLLFPSFLPTFNEDDGMPGR
jgi:hypothetical protein